MTRHNSSRGRFRREPTERPCRILRNIRAMIEQSYGRYIRKDFLEGRNTYGQKSLYKRYVMSKIWLFGMEPEGVRSFLQTYGWRAVEHLGYEELHESYVKPTGRQLAVMPIERIVYAEKL